MNRKAIQTALQRFCAYYVSQRLPFAIYRLPGEKKALVVAQKNGTVHTLNNSSNESGFVVAPFVAAKSLKAQLIQPDIFCVTDEIPKTPDANPLSLSLVKNSSASSHQRASFVKYVNLIKQNIREKQFNKAVAARSSIIKQPLHFNAVKLFNSLCKQYPDAFVYLLYTKDSGMWLGASPEVLLQYRNKRFLTYALAGTRLHSNQPKAWGIKEQEEQGFVTTYIRHVFNKFNTQKLQVEEPVTHRAGHLEHIRTTISHSGIPFKDWKKLVDNLHPTPAVAGLPKRKALSFIQANEATQRQLYSGFLGPLNLGTHQLELFVNLRCMRIHSNTLELFAGCGITAGSVGYKEWEETNHKMETLIRLL